ncbi:PREDICTED: uncharacterized protein LOC105569426 [Vollenhovia emeryi]|uniref:uncharacterized protein LOC105569426 n=1 Tax=Vollenhovia emeryi TaxID=411798 RepID=UPI0005F4F2F8|nr:PREDICTED: uncharacterized protein LOC105569426 [Vollenhovia emeryi]
MERCTLPEPARSCDFEKSAVLRQALSRSRRNCQEASVATAPKDWTSGRRDLRDQQIGERKGHGEVISENIGGDNASERSGKPHGPITSEINGKRIAAEDSS